MRVGARTQLKTLLRGVVLSRPVRSISEWLHADPGAGKANARPPAKICFIHVPKTGGTFVTQRENSDRTVVLPMQDLNHVTLVNEDWEMLRDVPAPFGEANALPVSAVDDMIVFSNVRNIFSFFVSYFHHAAGHVERYRNSHHYDFSIAHKGFDYLMKTVSDRGSIWPSRKFVHYQLFSQPSGVSVVDWINCTATLDRDLRAMAQNFGLEFRAGKPQRQGPGNDYRSYYSDALADLVSKTWKREIELFGFGFDLPQSKYTPIELADRVRAVRYVWREDQLLRQDVDTDASRAKGRSSAAPD
ncbi:MAG TPA: hypothetical protein VGN55_01835 [Xanthobacteraceae bacterium]|jgi:hypothetical protein